MSFEQFPIVFDPLETVLDRLTVGYSPKNIWEGMGISKTEFWQLVTSSDAVMKRYIDSIFIGVSEKVGQMHD